jgi:hypothetical protein
MEIVNSKSSTVDKMMGVKVFKCDGKRKNVDGIMESDSKRVKVEVDGAADKNSVHPLEELDKKIIGQVEVSICTILFLFSVDKLIFSPSSVLFW